MTHNNWEKGKNTLERVNIIRSSVSNVATFVSHKGFSIKFLILEMDIWRYQLALTLLICIVELGLI